MKTTENPAEEKGAESEDNYDIMAQSSATNQLLHRMVAKPAPGQIDRAGTANMSWEDFNLEIKGYEELIGGVKNSASKLLTTIIIKATANGFNDSEIRFPLKEYMHMRGLKDKDHAAKQVKNDLTAISRIEYEFRSKKSKREWARVSVWGGYSALTKGEIRYTLSNLFIESLKTNDRFLLMQLNEKMMQTNDNNNPYAWAFGMKMTEHYRMNAGKINENVISVKTLVNSCDNFPTFDEVMASNRNITDRIIEPFKRDLNSLEDLFTWEYTGGEPKTFEEFISNKIKFFWINPPDMSSVLKGRAKYKSVLSAKDANETSRIKRTLQTTAAEKAETATKTKQTETLPEPPRKRGRKKRHHDD